MTPSRGGFKRRAVVSNVELLRFGTAVARRLKRALCIAISSYNSRIRIVLRQTTTDKVNMKLKAKKSTSNVNLSKTEDINSSVKCSQASTHTFDVKEIGRTSDKNRLASRRPSASSFPIFIIISLFRSAVHNEHLSRDHPSPLPCEHSCDSLYHGRWYLYSIHYRYFT